jgi:peptide-methionine (R)-S-oxide reductase
MADTKTETRINTDPAALTDAEWRRRLSPEQYRVLREHGTERAGTSPLNAEKRAGVFRCAGCGQELFDAATKYESGSGWPSFWAPVEGAVATKEDRSLFMRRTEVLCGRCGGHLGHVFPDGPRPTGERYCMNGVALKFTMTPAAWARTIPSATNRRESA